ncbi:MAG TPA: hypothetical protein VK399_17025, partial [Longimicrobiaceae bacterium]|nr:hypothetical protein [Longimicrobiaceae bacterium]
MKLNLNAAAWRERARGAWPRFKRAWRDRQERKILIAFSVLGLASCGTGAVAAAWTRACVGTCPTAEQIADFAPQQASQ